MDTSNFNDGIRAQAGVGTRVRNIGGKLIYEAIQQPFLPAVPDPIKPLRMIIDNTGERGVVRFVAGKINEWYADARIDPQEDGTVAHPYFTLPAVDDETSIADGDTAYVEATVSFDGVYWRIDSCTIKIGVLPDPLQDDTHFRLALNPLSVDADGTVTQPSPQQFIGNIGWARRGTDTVYVDDWWNLTA